jgi:Transposase DDE domain
MVRVGTVAVDSTKLAANASLDQNRTYAGLRAEAERIIEEALLTDRREDELYGERRGDELPEELADPRTRKARIRELLEQARAEHERAQAERDQLVARQAERRREAKDLGGRPVKPEGGYRQRQLEAKKYNLTDPDSGIVRHRGMLMQGYNVHAAVGEGQVILATSVSRLSPDGGQLEPTVKLAEENLARIGASGQITQVLADSGYWQTSQIKALRASGLEVLVPPLIRASTPERANPQVRQMKTRLETEHGRDAYKRRQQIVEPVFAQIKHIRGITRVLKRGKDAVQAEIDLIATTHNLLKLRAGIQSPSQTRA